MQDSMLPGEWQQRSHAITLALIERINAEPEFRQNLIDDPDMALESAGFNDPIDLLERNTPLQWCTQSCPQSCGYTCTKTGTIKKTKKG
jgi:hypothetical protein